MQNDDLTYTIKVAMNKEGIKKFRICLKCNVCNSPKRERCIKCMRKL